MMKKTEEYKLNVQDLMDMIPTATVAKQCDILEDTDGKIVDTLIRWVIDEKYVIYSGIRDVYSIGQNFEENFEFILKAKDYKKFVTACKARRNELLGKGANKKTR